MAAGSSCTAERGSFTLAGVLLLNFLLLGTAGWVAIAERSQASIARQARADVCARARATEQVLFLGRLTTQNQDLDVLRKIIYAARGLAVAAPASALGEKAALAGARALAAAQEFSLLAHLRLAASRSPCPPGNFSREALICSPLPFVFWDFQREKSLFPDVPGPLRLQRPPPWKVECAARLPYSEKTLEEIYGDPRLEKAGFRTGRKHAAGNLGSHSAGWNSANGLPESA